MRAEITITLLLSAILAPSGFSQEYPLWFLQQGKFPCSGSAVGYVHASMYQDSAIAYALRQAETTYQRQCKVKISGSQSFWATEGGTFWMGSDVKEELDSAAGSCSLIPVDTMKSGELIFVLAAPSACESQKFRGVSQALTGTEKPAWLETLPRDPVTYYAVGVAPQYFYEKSSWDEAERLARRNLARTVCSSYKSLQKSTTTEAQDIRYEEVSVTLTNYRVEERWFDSKEKIFSVLVSMKQY